MAKKVSKLFDWDFCLSLILITLGAVMSAVALELILIPNSMIDGGMNGISIIINTLFGGSLGIIIFLVNLPFLILGYKQLGKKFIIKAGYGMILFSVLLEVCQYNACESAGIRSKVSVPDAAAGVPTKGYDSILANYPNDPEWEIVHRKGVWS